MGTASESVHSVIRLSELLDPEPSDLWTLIKQCGVDNVVALLDGGEQQQRWLRADGANSGVPVSPERDAWSFGEINSIVERFRAHELHVVAIEDTPPMDGLRLGGPDAELQMRQIHEQIVAMGQLGIPVLCYNWMIVTSWARTATDIPARGGALTTGYRQTEADAAQFLLPPGAVTHEQLWTGLDRFLAASLPVAEEAGVKLALHPDDPPLPSVRGVPRIISSLEAYRRILSDHPSPSNCITFCQGNFGLMTTDLRSAIAEFLPHIAFVHFRDVRGEATDFVETFHDDGPTDLAACMRLYVDAGYDGPMRPDHVPTMFGESNTRPGYATLGRLFALGYIRGLEHAVLSERLRAAG